MAQTTTKTVTSTSKMIPLDEDTMAKALALPPRLKAIAIYIAKGFTTQEIAALICLSPSTTSDHVKRLYKFLDVGSRCEVAVIATKVGLV